MPNEMVIAVNDSSNAELLEQTYFTTFNTYQTALQGMRAGMGQSLSRASEFRDQLKLHPPGAKGPEQNNRLRGWAKYYGQYFTHESNGLNPEYDTTLHGGVIGIDTCAGNLLIGISGGSSYSRITDANDARRQYNILSGRPLRNVWNGQGLS